MSRATTHVVGWVHLAIALAVPGCAFGVMDDIARSHVDAYVPPPDKFQPLLRRDLALYFRKSKTEKVTVEPEMLRDGPTQSGLSFPKFYVWARVFTGGRLREEGAVRLAAVEGKRFDVTDYLSKAV